MNELCPDIELLRAFIREGKQSAFADLVRRHINLVYGTALRRVEDASAAEEISQNVFTALAKKAWQFAPDDSLPAWLHRTALLESKACLRGELRRRRREQTAAELGTTMNAFDQQAAFHAMTPILDDALLSLREKERTALLLRFYENRSLREVGSALGVSEDTAQKRVAAALEQLAAIFQKRGFRTTTSAIAMAALQKTAVTASAATISTVVNAALTTAPAISTFGMLASRLMSFTKMQTAVLCIVLGTGPVAWQWNEHQVSASALAQRQAELISKTSDEERLQADLERLRASEQKLEAELLNAAEVRQQNEELAKKVQSWKLRVRRLLTANDYRWPDDLPFVRIPKSAIAKMAINMPITPPGHISVPAREMFGVTQQERKAIENQLTEYFSGLDRMIESRIYETNRSDRSWNGKDALASTVLVVPRLGEDAKRASEGMLSTLKDSMGPERWKFIEAETKNNGTHTLRTVLRLDADHEQQEIMVKVDQGEQELSWSMQYSTDQSSYGSAGSALAAFLPGSNPEIIAQAEQILNSNALPIVLQQRIHAWLEQQAKTRLVPEGRR